MKLPAALRKFKVYTEAEFIALKGKENRQERLLAAVVDDRLERLSDTDFRYFLLLKRAYNILTDEFSPVIAQKKVARLLEVSSPARLRQITRDVQAIFCNLAERSQELEKQLMIHKLSKLIARIERNDPLNLSLPSYYKLLGEWKGIGKEVGINPDDFELPPVMYSDDINDLHDNVEDIEHEEV